MDELLSELEQSITISFLYRTSLEKHLNYEYEYLSNHSASISLFAFQSFSNMPYIISRKLYNTMNTSKNQKLSKEEFINGFITVYFGSIEERLKFLFDFFTFDNKTIHIKDLKILLNNIILFSQIPTNLIEEFFGKIICDNNSEIIFDNFVDYIVNKDCGIYYVFFLFMFRFKNFNNEYLSFLMSIKDLMQFDNNVNTFGMQLFKNIPSQKKEYSSISTQITNSSNNLSFKSKVFDSSFDFFKKTVSLSKMSQPAIEIINKIHFINKNNKIENDLFIDGDKSSVDDDIEDNDLLELSKFESEIISTKSSLNISTPSKEQIHKIPYTPSPKNCKYSTILINNVMSLYSERIKNSFENETVYYQHNNVNEKQCKIRLFDNNMIIYREKENIIIDLIPLFKIFPSDISKSEENSSIYYKVILTSVIFPNYNFCSSFLFSKKETANDFINAINTIEQIKKYSEDYEIISLIGEGHFGKVYKVKSIINNNIFAMKILNRDILNQSSNDLEIMNNELDISRTILSMSHNDNIIHCYGTYESPSQIAMIYDYIENGTLTAHLNSQYSLDKIDNVISQVIHGVQFLNAFGVVHRDLKPENILIDNNKVIRLIDFGLSKVVSFSEKLNENYGTLLFTAPEILLSNEYNVKVDVWSVGVLAFYLLFGTLPFSVNDKDLHDEIAIKIISKEMCFPYRRIDRNQTDMRIRKFIVKALNKNSSERPYMNDIVY